MQAIWFPGSPDVYYTIITTGRNNLCSTTPDSNTVNIAGMCHKVLCVPQTPKKEVNVRKEARKHKTGFSTKKDKQYILRMFQDNNVSQGCRGHTVIHSMHTPVDRESAHAPHNKHTTHARTRLSLSLSIHIPKKDTTGAHSTRNLHLNSTNRANSSDIVLRTRHTRRHAEG